MFSIGKMAQFCHTSIQTLRYYDKIGLLSPSYQDPQSNYRYYKLDQIFQFTIIKYLQSTGLSLEKIKEIMNKDDVNMIDFWKKQEKEITQRIEEEKKSLKLAQFQQMQFKKLQLLKEHLNKSPYIRKIEANIIEIPIKNIVTPADTPDNTVSNLDRKILESGLLPNLEYCFTFKGDKYNNLEDIHYLSTFKEIDQKSTNSTSLTGTFLCISFMWDRKRYLHYLNKLLTEAVNKYGVKNPTITEDSYPLNYDQAQLNASSNSITELRIRIK